MLICATLALSLGSGVAAALSVTRGESYWLVSSSGQVFAFGKARNYGSEAGKRFRGGIVGIVSTPNGEGYWLISSRGRHFGFGDSDLYRYRSTKLQKLTGHVRVKGLRGKIVGVAIAKLPVSPPLTTTLPVKTTTTDTATTATTSTTSTTTSASADTPEPLVATTGSLPAAAQEIPYSAGLTASGGTPPYSWTLVSGALPPEISLEADGTLTGSPIDTGTYGFTVEVTDAAGESAPEALSVTVDLGEENWSGYAEQDATGDASGPAYTGASGTFTVPALESSDAAGEYFAEWVGIDGYESTDPDLIQAGVEIDSNGSGGETVQPWWEILPASETPITSMTVSSGDSVSVTLAQTGQTCTITRRHGSSESGSNWTITLTDNSRTADSFTTTQCYAGPGDSAEWIVEAPQVDGSISTLAPFAPAVTFSDLSSSQTYTSLDEMVIVNNSDAIVSTPSPLDATGFTVAYGDNVPAAP